MPGLPHASDCFPRWLDGWRRTGALILLLDFDGTLAPIVERPEAAAMHPRSRIALDRLARREDVALAIVSGRGLSDARALAGLDEIAYAGNHGMEIEMEGDREVHAEAAATRPLLDEVADGLRESLATIPGAIVEDKGLTLSVHYRLVATLEQASVRKLALTAVAGYEKLRTTEGKMVVEIRPRVEWDKGRAVDFLLARLQPPAAAPVLYIGDDRTDEDAFRALRYGGVPGDGVLVADHPPETTEAVAWVESPDQVADLLEAFASARAAEADKEIGGDGQLPPPPQT